jgi:enoyl-CoA hydratase
MDTRAHLSASTEEFLGAIGAQGLKPALADRDAVFGDGRARVTEPEIRDANGQLVEIQK